MLVEKGVLAGKREGSAANPASGEEKRGGDRKTKKGKTNACFTLEKGVRHLGGRACSHRKGKKEVEPKKKKRREILPEGKHRPFAKRKGKRSCLGGRGVRPSHSGRGKKGLADPCQEKKRNDLITTRRRGGPGVANGKKGQDAPNVEGGRGGKKKVAIERGKKGAYQLKGLSGKGNRDSASSRRKKRAPPWGGGESANRGGTVQHDGKETHARQKRRSWLRKKKGGSSLMKGRLRFNRKKTRIHA